MEIREHEKIAPYTYFKIGGPARFFISATNTDEIIAAIDFAEEKKLPWFILSGGSNVLVADEGYPGVCIHVKTKTISIEENGILISDAGVSMAMLVRAALDEGLAGIEWGIGIPGAVGGSIRGNAGCFGGEMKDVVTSVELYDTKKKVRSVFTNSECQFGYRESIFKKRPELVILAATFSFSFDTKHTARQKMLEYVALRNTKQDIGSKCAGCIFKNATSKSAGEIIDEADCKGMRVGDASVSTKHANFILNNGNATAADVKLLIEKIKQKVKIKQNVILEEEIQYIK